MSVNMKSTSYRLLAAIVRLSGHRCRYRQASLYRQVRTLEHITRCYSTEPLPLPNDPQKTYSPKIQKIVDDISGLTLIEVADLNELLKKTLNIQDAPVMAMGAVAAAPAAAAGKAEEEEAAPQKMSYTVKLTGFAADKKIALIKELKNLVPGANLVQAKKMVESAPVVIRGDIPKEEADQLVKTIEAAGGKAISE